MEKTKRIIQKTVDWFRVHKVPLPWRESRDPYRIWISEVMLQQTRIETVIPYYQRFLEELPTVFDLAACEEEKLLKLWEGLGYYSRARNLKKCAEVLCAQCKGKFPQEAEQLEKLPGIGAYTAGAIASIAFGKRAPAVDGNVLRVMTRLFADKSDIALSKTREKIAAQLKEAYPEGAAAGDFTQGIMEIGETKCIPNGVPLCPSCPLAEECETRRQKLWEEIPYKSPKKERRIEEKTVFLLQCGEKYAIEKRADSGLLASLFGFPMADGHCSEASAREQLCRAGFAVQSIAPCGSAKHIFTHVEWHMIGFWAQVETPLPCYLWKTAPEILESVALPSAFRAFRKIIQKNG